jgi:hypothetical protein
VLVDGLVPRLARQGAPIHQSVTIIKARAAFESFTMMRQKAIASIVVNP